MPVQFDDSSQDFQDNQRRSSVRQRNDDEEGRVPHSQHHPHPHSRNSMSFPDIIECHTGLSVDFTYEGYRVHIGGYLNNHRIPRPLVPSSNNNEWDDRMEELPGREPGGADWRLELKLLVGPWQQAGMELRAIADHFQLEYAHVQELSSQRKRRLKCKLMVSLGIPTLALVGLGIAWLRRHWQ